MTLRELLIAHYSTPLVPIATSPTYRKATQGLIETNIFGHEQIGAFSLKECMVLFLYNEVDISWFHSRGFVCHALELNFRAVLHALFNVYLQYFPFRLGLRRISLSTTLAAWALHLRNHAWSQVAIID